MNQGPQTRPWALGGIVLTLLGLTAIFVGRVSWAVVRHAVHEPAQSSLEYGATLEAVDELLGGAGAEAPLALIRFTVRVEGRTLPLDSLALTDFGHSLPSLARGGHLREEVERYNAHQRERLRIAGDDAGAFTRLASYNPSLFRAVIRADGTRQVSRTAAAWSRRLDSPFSDRWDGSVLTEAGRSGWALSNPGITVPLWAPSLWLRRVDRRRQRCSFDVAGPDTHIRCLSEARTPQATIRGGAEAAEAPWLLAGWSPLEVEGERLAPGDSVQLTPGDLVEIEPLGPLVFGARSTGRLSDPQWVNGRVRRREEAAPPLDIVTRLGRRPVDPDQPPAPGANLRVSLHEDLTRELTEALESFTEELGIPVEFASVVVADAADGRIRILAEAGSRTEPGRSRLMERVVPGSAVKPLLAAAILSERPELGTLTVPARSGRVTRLLGVPLPDGQGFTTALNCGAPGSGRVDLRYFLRCSNNEYAAALLAASLEPPRRSGQPANLAAGSLSASGSVPRSVPRATLIEGALSSGMSSLYGLTTDPVIADRSPRSDRLWEGLRFTDGQPVRLPFSTLPDASRPVLLASPDAGSTDLGLLARYAFGAWENRWTLFDLTQAFGRVVVDRRIPLTLSAETVAAPGLGLSGQSWHRTLLRGLSDVAQDGTASGFAERARRAGIPGVVYAKTGTLAEADAGRGDGLFFKSLLFAAGPTEGGALGTPLQCGVVAGVYLQFEHGPRRGALPAYQLAFAQTELLPLLGERWTELGFCGSGTDERAP